MMDQTRYPSNFAFASSSGNPHVFHVGGEPQGNRSRLDSGTSGSSESSKGSGKPPRRRSHRPRGCRGGSNRRRNNPDGTKKPVNNSSSNNNNNNKMRDSKANSIGSRTLLSKNHPNHKQMKQGANVVPMQEYSVMSRQSQPSKQAFYIDCQQGLLQRDHSASSSTMSTSTAQMTEYSSFHGSVENQMFAGDFSVIEPSFSDSSSEFGTDSIPQDFGGIPSADSYSSTSSSGNTNNHNQILPPLPSNAFCNDYIQTGPNPYALKSATYENSNNMIYCRENIPQIHEPSDIAATKFAGGYATPMKNLNHHHLPPHHFYTLPFHSNNSNTAMGPPLPRPKLPLGDTNNTNYSKNSTIPVACSSENEYRAERLEIQRQCVEGGSLFVTSPRSFLMGKRNTAAAF